MLGPAWVYTLLCGVLVQSTGILNWSHRYLTEKVSIRIVKRDWRPLGPSSQTDDVMDDYRWDVDTAYNSLIKSSYTYLSAPLLKSEELFKNAEHYDSSLDSIIIIHPIFSTADVFFVKTTITAIAMKNLNRKYNLFAVDMGVLNFNMMESVFYNVFGFKTKYEPIAEVVSLFLVKGIDHHLLRPDQIHLLGWSYSGHLVGYMGRFIELLYGSKIGSILSLDPYTNSVNDDLMHVSKEDALVVHLFHSNSVLAGTRDRIGHADFMFNDGNIQPECSGLRVFKNTIPEPMICSHLKVVQRFWYVILYPSKFLARQCISWNRFISCRCENNPTDNMRFPIPRGSQASGTYYLRTIYTKPYGVGKWGATCSSEMRQELKNKLKLARLTLEDY